nr:reverse transcriptase domain-containing protein [Tanacetum cinerariifolium]
MKRRLEECYDLIENMTAHHNDWDTSAQRSESSSSITSSSDTKIAALKAEMAEINKNLIRPLLAKIRMYMLREPTKLIPTNRKMNTSFSSGSGTLPVEREIEWIKDTVPPTNNGSTKDVQPPVVQIETPILNSKLVVTPIIEPIAAPSKLLTVASLIFWQWEQPSLAVKCLGAGVEILEPGFELDDQEWVEMGSFLFVRLKMRIFSEQRIAAIKGYRGQSGGCVTMRGLWLYLYKKWTWRPSEKVAFMYWFVHVLTQLRKEEKGNHVQVLFNKMKKIFRRVQTSDSGISNLLAVATTFTGSGNLYCK